MKTIAAAFATVLALSSLSAHAGFSEVTPLGKGRYLIAGRALSIFGTPGKLQAKAMKVANEYCAREHSGTEAVLQSAEGRKAQSGWGAGGGGFAAGGGGNNAEAEVIFTCEAPDAANP